MSINLVAFSGRLGNDPEVKQTSGGKTVAKFSLAVDDGYGDSKSTVWIRCEAWDKTAEAVSRFLVKGARAAVTGSLKDDSYESNGTKKTQVKVRVDRVEVIDYPETSAVPVGAGVTNDSANTEISDDDIPF